jgi:hypothetical protein
MKKKGWIVSKKNDSLRDVSRGFFRDEVFESKTHVFHLRRNTSTDVSDNKREREKEEVPVNFK